MDQGICDLFAIPFALSMTKAGLPELLVDKECPGGFLVYVYVCIELSPGATPVEGLQTKSEEQARCPVCSVSLSV